VPRCSGYSEETGRTTDGRDSEAARCFESLRACLFPTPIQLHIFVENSDAEDNDDGWQPHCKCNAPDMDEDRYTGEKQPSHDACARPPTHPSTIVGSVSASKSER
jgi:hypothetical protein